MADLLQLKSQHLPNGTPPLDTDKIRELLTKLPDWTTVENDSAIKKTFTFNNYPETIEFVNLAAHLIHEENHHPEMLIGYKTCQIVFTTHTVQGLSLNDFICAAKLDALSTE